MSFDWSALCRGIDFAGRGAGGFPPTGMSASRADSPTRPLPDTNWRSPMRRLFQWAEVGISALPLTGCATMNVGSHVKRGLNFAQYRTYDWGPPTHCPRETHDSRRPGSIGTMS